MPKNWKEPADDADDMEMLLRSAGHRLTRIERKGEAVSPEMGELAGAFGEILRDVADMPADLRADALADVRKELEGETNDGK